MESAQHRKKESTSQAARYVKSCRLKSTGAPPVYGTGWANFPWAALDADLSNSRGIPTRELLTAPLQLLHLSYYHSADVTSQTRALLRQSDVPHDARWISRAL